MVRAARKPGQFHRPALKLQFALDVREDLKKKYGIIWEFFPNVGGGSKIAENSSTGEISSNLYRTNKSI